MPQKKNIARKLKLLIDTTGKTQQQVAKEAGVSQPTVVGWLNGAMPNGANLAELARANGVSATWFLEVKPDPERARNINLGLEHATGNLSKNPVDNVSESDNNTGVKLTLPDLLERLKKATEERGKKSELAKFLDVRLVQVSQWLSGDREPGGKITLQMLQWVEQQERQK
jgi:transcriptional regulator with XRE-family HTH domain